MKTFYLLRHAKSSWDHPNLKDFQRPLSNRGLKAAPLMGRMMLENNLIPEIIISSPAKRAKQTAVLVRESAQIAAEITFNEKIYGASTSEILDIVAKIADEAGSAILVGHNPTFENTVRVLTGDYVTMPTAALAVIDLKINKWNSIAPGCGSLREFFRPKELY